MENLYYIYTHEKNYAYKSQRIMAENWDEKYPQYPLKDIFECADRLNKPIRNAERIILLNQAYLKLKESYEDVCFPDKGISATFHIENYFIQLFIFLERWNHYWINNGLQKNIIKLSDNFKNNDTVTIAKLIRNRIIHANTIINTIGFTQDGIQLYTNKDDLYYERIGKNRLNILNTQPQLINLINVVEDSYKQAQLFHNKSLLLHNDEQFRDDLNKMKEVRLLLKNKSKYDWAIAKETINNDLKIRSDVYYMNWDEYNHIRDRIMKINADITSPNEYSGSY